MVKKWSRLNKFYLSAILAIVIVISTFSQEKEPKVGLVLSGGGAKGLAHIGVLKVLEQEGIKVDYIGGTSMGAIIGGLYASGYSARELDSIFRVTDFEQLVQDNIPRSNKSVYERDNDEKYALNLPFHKFKIGIPLAFSKGQNIYNLLNRLTFRVAHISDFKKLPIPFICIATDIENGESLILDKGYLPKAMMASGSFPSLFNPVEIEGRTLIDGGITNNYPIDEIKKLGADIIIGVDVQDKMLDKDEINSAAKILVQIVNFQMYKDIDNKREKTDIYIKPDIKGFNVVSFNMSEQIVKNGEIAAQEVINQIKELAKKINSKPEEKKYNPTNNFKINSIEINGLQNYSRSYVLGKLKITNNDNITFNDLEKGLNSLNSTQNFKSISYQFKNTENDSLSKLVFNLQENNIKTYLKLGLHYDDLYKSAALVNLTQKNILTKNDVASIDVILGDNIRYNAEYYIDNGFHWSLGIRSRFNQFKVNVPSDFITDTYVDLSKINIKYQDFTNQIFIQTLFEKDFTLGLGLEYKVIDTESETVNLNGNQINKLLSSSNYLSGFTYLKYDTFDNRYFPKKGVLLDASLRWVLNSNKFNDDQFGKYTITQGSISFAKTFYKYFTLRVQPEAGFFFGEANSMLNFSLGGYGNQTINNFKHFYGYDFLSLTGNSYIKGLIGIDVEFLKKQHLNFYANYANIGKDIFNAIDQSFTKVKHSGYAVGYGLETMLGPIEIKHSWSPDTKSHFWWFNIGFFF